MVPLSVKIRPRFVYFQLHCIPVSKLSACGYAVDGLLEALSDSGVRCYCHGVFAGFIMQDDLIIRHNWLVLGELHHATVHIQ